MRDSLNRSWQLGTVQLDYNFPERFDLTYTGADNAEHQPAMLHRALVGSFERFIGILLEHTGGELPLWLAPVQAAVLPLADRHNDYAHEVAAALRAAELRAEVDDRTESVGRKIREAELRKVPYMLVVGDREAEERAVGAAPPRRGRPGHAPARRGRRSGSRARSAAEARPPSPGCSCALAAPAHASTAMVVIVDSCGSDVACGKYDGGHGVPVVIYLAAGGEANRLTVSRAGDELTLSDPAAPVTARDDCRCRRRPYGDAARRRRRLEADRPPFGAARRRRRHPRHRRRGSVSGPASREATAPTR